MVLDHITVHGKTYEIHDRVGYDWTTYVKLKVENKYESGFIWRRLDDLKCNKFKDPLKLNVDGTYYGLGNMTVKLKVIMEDGTIDRLNLKSKYSKIINRSLKTKYTSNSNRKFYKNVAIDEEWLSYQKFAKWVASDKSNFRLGYQIDKDILGNRYIYGPDSCVYIPPYLNKYLASFEREKRTKYLSIYKATLTFESDTESNKYKHAALRLLSLAYYKADMIPKRIYDVIIRKYIDMSLSYNMDIYYKISEIIDRHVKEEAKIYKKVNRIETMKRITFRD